VVIASRSLHDALPIWVVPTEAALNFVGAATFEALSGHPVSTTVFDAVDEVQHVNIGQHADAVVVAPATADVIARIAAGRADDLRSEEHTSELQSRENL